MGVVGQDGIGVQRDGGDRGDGVDRVGCGGIRAVDVVDPPRAEEEGKNHGEHREVECGGVVGE